MKLNNRIKKTTKKAATPAIAAPAMVPAPATPVALTPVAKPPVVNPPVAKPPVVNPPVMKPLVTKPTMASEPPAAKPSVVNPPVAKPPMVSEIPAARPVRAEPSPTTIEARIDVGFGNHLFVRGQGAGLSWERGTPLKCVDGQTWRWSAKTADNLTFKLLLNDMVWAQGEDLVATPGKYVGVAPQF